MVLFQDLPLIHQIVRIWALRITYFNLKDNYESRRCIIERSTDLTRLCKWRIKLLYMYRRFTYLLPPSSSTFLHYATLAAETTES